ncbi:solute carrier organic anion transporter family member 2A1-like [Diorhabda carinulata]|uniref:solute carrier organic anion transporter family member 2A1-like n=1 Tax=Diorhabda carinulata TaxID=1163345 RepID=UPI0025A2295A|nr:solute carrier organic anion transporter family member 2A1-like [Diorhabda carinulata]
MVHPTSLLRSDSDGAQRFAAPVENYWNEIDCGIKALPCLAERLQLQKLAKLSVFVTVLSIIGYLRGLIVAYMNGTSQLWIKHYNFPSFATNWMTVSNEVFNGLLALCISYWGARLHRSSWIGGFTMVIAVSGATLTIPEIYHPFTGVEITNTIIGPSLCGDPNGQKSSNNTSFVTFDEVTFGYYIIFELIFGIMTVSFITHGLSYIDDHTSAKHSPVLIGVILAAHEFGKFGGIYCSWSPFILHISGIFISPIWLTVIIVTFLAGFVMVLFPTELPSMVLKKSVNDLVNIASGGNRTEEKTNIDGFFRTVWNLINNNILLLNVMSLTLLQSAMINFGLSEKYFNQSKYHVSIEEDTSGYTDPSIMQFTTNLLRQPFVSVCLITSGFFMAKLRPRLKYLVSWNITAVILVIMIFSSTAFLNCNHQIQNEHKHSITIPYCSSHCGCPVEESFQPVCVDGKTYFSPCLAGCRNFTSATLVYDNCSCGITVTEGSCDEENCKFILALAQVNKIIINGIVASALLVNIIIIMRVVRRQDKATALGLELTFFGIVPYVPIKIIYHFIIDRFCEIKSEKGCQYFSDNFPLAVSLITIGLMVCAVFLLIALFFIAKKNNKNEKNYNSDYELNGFNENVTNNNNSQIIISEEQIPFVNQSRRNPPLSRQERIQSYIEEGELVPPLLPPKKKNTKQRKILTNTPSTSTNSNISENTNKKTDISRPGSRTSNRRNSKASAESDMSSLYRFADSIENLDDNSSQSSKVKSPRSSRKIDHEPKLSLNSSEVMETEF